MIYRRSVRYGACSCFLFLFLFFIFRQLTSRDAPPCVCLPLLSLFDLIAVVPLSLLLHFMSMCGALVVLVFALSSYLGCLALLIYVYGCHSCPTRMIYMWSPWFISLLFLGFSILNPFLAKMSFAGYFHARFLLSAFFPVCLSYFVLFFPIMFVPDLFWCNFLYLVNTAGFIADQQLIMRDKQQRVCATLCHFGILFSLVFFLRYSR